MRNDSITRRRLADGERAMNLPLSIEPLTATEIRAQIDIVYQGAVALQSLDDLGSDEANKKAWDDMRVLEFRLDQLRKQLAKLESK